MSVSRPILFASSLLSASAAVAQENTPTVMPDVVVSATRIPTPAEQVASTVTVITAEEIARKQQRTLPEVLREVPGLNVVQNGKTGVASVFMRGTNANHTKVIIDGIYASDPTSPDGSFDFSQILTSDIERVEVLRGPQSGLYGSDAVGGVVNITTRKGKGPLRARASAEAGSFNTFNQTAGVSGGMERFSYAFNAAHQRVGESKSTPTDLIPFGRDIKDDTYDNKTFSTQLGADITDNFDLGFVGRYTDVALDNTSDDFLGPQPLRSETDNRQYLTRGTAHLALFDGKFDQTLGVGLTDYRRRYEDPNAPFNNGLFAGDRLRADWQGDIKLMPGQTLTLAAEHQREKADKIPGAKVTNRAGSVQLQSEFGESLFNTMSLRRDDHEQFGGKTTWRIAPAYLIRQTDTKLKASYGTGLKAPTLEQLYRDYPAFFFTANPNLSPETSKGYDAGFEQDLWGKRVQFGATYFHNDIKDFITYNNTFTTLINVGEATTRGVESYLAYKPLDVLSFRADHTYTLAENDQTKAQLLRRPKNKASLTAAWNATEALELSATTLHTGSWVDRSRDGMTGGLRPGSYTTLNLAGSYTFENGVNAFARIDNLFDKRYENPVGFEQSGIGAYAGVKLSFDASGLKP